MKKLLVLTVCLIPNLAKPLTTGQVICSAGILGGLSGTAYYTYQSYKLGNQRKKLIEQMKNKSITPAERTRLINEINELSKTINSYTIKASMAGTTAGLAFLFFPDSPQGPRRNPANQRYNNYNRDQYTQTTNQQYNRRTQQTTNATQNTTSSTGSSTQSNSNNNAQQQTNAPTISPEQLQNELTRLGIRQEHITAFNQSQNDDTTLLTAWRNSCATDDANRRNARTAWEASIQTRRQTREQNDQNTVQNPAPNQADIRLNECPLTLHEGFIQPIALACGHEHCPSCLEDLAVRMITQNNRSEFLCPTIGCRRPISDTDFQRIVLDSTQPANHANNRFPVEALAGISLIAAENDITTAMAQDPNFKQCPSPNCRNAFINDPNNNEQTRCVTCRRFYCPQCLIRHPRTVTCQQAQFLNQHGNAIAQNANASNDRAFQDWLRLNTKNCPNSTCNLPIQKNDGCLHMTCFKCRHEFCWQCLRPWRGHSDYYRCGARNPWF